MPEKALIQAKIDAINRKIKEGPAFPGSTFFFTIITDLVALLEDVLVIVNPPTPPPTPPAVKTGS